MVLLGSARDFCRDFQDEEDAGGCGVERGCYCCSWVDFGTLMLDMPDECDTIGDPSVTNGRESSGP